MLRKSNILFLLSLLFSSGIAAQYSFGEEKPFLSGTAEKMTESVQEDQAYASYIDEGYYRKKMRDKYYLYGRQSFDKKRYKEAIANFKAALQYDPEYELAQIYINLTEVRITQKENLETKKLMVQHSVNTQRENLKKRNEFFNKGREFFVKGSFKEAVINFKSAQEVDPSYKPAILYITLAEKKIAWQEKKESERILEIQKKQEEEEQKQEELLAKEAEEEFLRKEKLKEEEEKKQAALKYYKEGQEQFLNGRYQDAIVSLRSSITNNPGFKEPQDLLISGEKKILELRKVELEHQRLVELEVTKEKAAQKQAKLSVSLKQGHEHFNSARFKEAIESFKQALEVEPKEKEALSYINFSQAKIDEAVLQEKKRVEEENRQKALKEKQEELNKQKALLEENRKAELAKKEAEAKAKKEKEEQKQAKISEFLKQGHEHFNSARFKEAIEIFKRTLEVDPKEKEALLYIKLSQAKIDEAVLQEKKRVEEENLQKELKEKLEQIEKQKALLEENRKAELAKQEAEDKAAKEKEAQRQAKISEFLKQGHEHFNSARFKEAIEIFKQALEVDPKEKEALQYIKLSQAKIDEAVFQEKKRVEEENRKAELAKQEAEDKAAKEKEALRKEELLKKAAEAKAAKRIKDEKLVNRNFYYKKGVEFYRIGQYKESIVNLKLALEVDPEYKPIKKYLKQAEEKFVEQAKIEEQSVESEKSLKIRNEKIYASRNHYFQGVAYFKEHKYKEAIASFNLALEIDPGYQKAIFYIKRAQNKFVEQTKAEEEKIFSEKRIQDEQEKREQLLAQLDKEEQDRKAKIEHELAIAAERLKKQQEKIEILETYFKKGMREYHEAQYIEAIASFKLALEIDPSYRKAVVYLERAEKKVIEQVKLDEEKIFIEKRLQEEQVKRQAILARLAKEEEEERLKLKQKRVYEEEQMKKELEQKEITDTNYKKGVSYYNKAQYKEAIASFNLVLETAPKYKDTKRYLKLAENKFVEQTRLEEENVFVQKQEEDNRQKREQILAKLAKEEEEEKLRLKQKYVYEEEQMKKELEQKEITDTNYKKGVSYYNKAQYEEALIALKACLESDPEYKPAKRLLNKTQAMVKRGKTIYIDKILEERSKTQQINSMAEKARVYNQGKILFDKEEYKKALDAFQKVLSLDQRYKPAAIYIDLCKEKLIQQTKVVEQELPVEKQVGYFDKNERLREIFYEHGLGLYNSSRFNEAVGKFRQVLKYDPDYEPALIYIALAEEKISQKKREFAGMQDDKKMKLCDIFYMQGKVLFDNKDYKDAINKFKEALKYDSQFKPALIYIELAQKNLTRNLQ